MGRQARVSGRGPGSLPGPSCTQSISQPRAQLANTRASGQANARAGTIDGLRRGGFLRVVATSAISKGIPALRHASAARLDLARAAHRNGVGVVGLVGNTIPVELILACGRVPVLIAADVGRPTPSADV